MLKKNGARLALIIIILLVCFEGSLAKKRRGNKRKHKSSSLNEINTRSALVGIKPEDLIKSYNDGGSRGSRKSDVDLLHHLPELQEEERLTDNALAYSRLLSPIDQSMMKEFDKVTGEKSGNLAPGDRPKTGGVDPNSSFEPKGQSNDNRNSRDLTGQVMGDGMGRTEEFNPLRDDSNSNPQNLNLDKDFYRQISQLEEGGPRGAKGPSVGHISDIYKDNPLPEYSFRESDDAAAVSDYHPEQSFSKFDKYNPFEMPKNDYQQQNEEQELFDGYSNGPEKQHSDVSAANSDLFSVIGKKVLLNLLNHRNDSQSQSDQKLRQDLLSRLVGMPHGDTNGANFLANQLAPTPSRSDAGHMGETTAKASVNQMSTLPSQNVATIGKISSDQGQGLTAQQETQHISLPQGINLQIMGHLSKSDPMAPKANPTPPMKEDLTTTRKSSPTQKQQSNLEMQSDSPVSVGGNEVSAKDGPLEKENLVTLKISRAGKPVSFKADTSNDGSLVLKIPGNVTFMDTAENKGVREPTFNHPEDSNSLESIVSSQTEELNHHWEENPAHLQDFVKKQKMEPNGVGNLEELSNWQILGKTNPTFNHEDHGEVNNVVQVANKALSSVRPTANHLSYNLNGNPTVRQDLNQEPPTKHSELSSVSFAGVGLQPPSEIFGSSNSRLRQHVPIRSMLRPSKFLEDSADVRGKLNFGSIYAAVRKPTAGRLRSDKWNMWSPCSVTCGQGVQARARLCEGMECKGYRTESKACFKEICPEQLWKAGLRLHNKFRAWHKSPPLKWSERLAAKAQKMAAEMANRKSFHLSDFSQRSGVNIAQLWHSYDIAAEKATADWYSEVKSFNFEEPKIDDSTKHFTQLIWKDSKEVGIGAAKSRDGEYTFVVALYDPPGNISHEEKHNVHLPRPSS